MAKNSGRSEKQAAHGAVMGERLRRRALERRLRETGLSEVDYAARVEAGQRWCQAGQHWRGRGDFTPNKHRPDGLNAYCRDCVNEQQRACYKRRLATGARRLQSGTAMDKVPPALRPKAAVKSIGCLSCRHCELLPHSDFSKLREYSEDSIIPIRCNKERRARPMVWRDCPAADPRPAQPKKLARYWKKYGPLGDRNGHATPALLAFLAAHWQSAPADFLERVTGRTVFKLNQMVRYHGVGGVAAGKTRLHLMEPQKGRPHFTASQTEWLLREYSSERWPRPANSRLPADELSRRLEARRRVVDGVNGLNPDGPRWNWEQIGWHISKQLKGRRARAVRARRGEGRKVNQWMSVPVEVTYGK